MRDFEQLILRWPTVADFARDIGVPYETARKMRTRNNIIHEHWSDVLAAARDRGIELTLEDLMRLSRRRRRMRAA